MEYARMDSVIRRSLRKATTGAAQPKLPVPPRAGALPARHSVRAQVLRALRGALGAGELVPGQVYSAPLLAERYGVSATPVREAMQQLASEGAVEPVPNRGFRVAGLTVRDLAELAAIRADLEVPAVMRLARTLPVERWEQLRPLADAAVTVAGRGDRLGYAEADLAFHAGLLRLTGNRQLVTVVGELHRRAQCPTACRTVPGTAELLATAREHGALLDALAITDHTTAERLAREHFTAPEHR